MFDYPLWGLFLSAVLSSTLLPGGSEAALAYLTRAQGHELWLLLAVAATGNTLGGMSSWLVGRVIAVRYPAERIVSPMESPPTTHSDEERQNRAGTPDRLWEGLPAATSRLPDGSPMGLARRPASGDIIARDGVYPGSVGNRAGVVPPVRQSPPTIPSDEEKRVIPRHSCLVPRPSAQAVERLRRWGASVLLLSWLPVIGDPLCVAAGWLRIHWLLSLVLIGLGKTVRYAVVVLLFM